MPEFIIKIQDLEEGRGEFAFPIRPEWLAESLADAKLRPPASPFPDAEGVPGFGKLEVSAQSAGDDVLLRTAIRTRVLAECSRCLGDVPVEVDLHLHNMMSPANKRAPLPEELELTPEEVAHEFFSGDKLILDELVREHILLEVPMQPLCSDDCGGISIPDGVRAPDDWDAPEEGVDPRLAPLMKLKNELSKTEE